MNRESYNAIAPSWDAARTTLSDAERRYLDLLLADAPAPSDVLDLGCGTGRPLGAEILARGHRLTGVDQAGELLALARSRFPAATWIEARIEDFVPSGTYAAALLWDSLFHIPRAHHEAIFGRVARALRPGGRLMATVGGSAHPAFTDTMFGETFFYDSHPPEIALQLLEGQGFEIVLAEFLNPPTGGRDKGRFGIVVEVAGAARNCAPPRR